MCTDQMKKVTSQNDLAYSENSVCFIFCENMGSVMDVKWSILKGPSCLNQKQENLLEGKAC